MVTYLIVFLLSVKTPILLCKTQVLESSDNITSYHLLSGDFNTVSVSDSVNQLVREVTMSHLWELYIWYIVTVGAPLPPTPC